MGTHYSIWHAIGKYIQWNVAMDKNEMLPLHRHFGLAFSNQHLYVGVYMHLHTHIYKCVCHQSSIISRSGSVVSYCQCRISDGKSITCSLHLHKDMLVFIKHYSSLTPQLLSNYFFTIKEDTVRQLLIVKPIC